MRWGTRDASARWNDRGAGALEYGALVGVAAMVVGLLFTAVPGVAEPGIKDAVCALFGGECGDGRPGADDGGGGDGDGSEGDGDERDSAAEQDPCVVSAVERNTIRQTLLGIDTEVNGETRGVQILSDGGAVVKEGTVHGEGKSIGFSFDLPKGAGGSVQLTAAEITEQGEILHLKTQQDRELYLQYFKANGRLDLEALSGQMSGDQYLEAKSMLEGMRSQMVQSQYTKVTREGTVKIAASLFGADAAAELGLGASSIVEHNKRTGEDTTTFQVDAKALGKLGILLGPEAHGQADGQVSLAITTDAQGRPKKLQVGGQMAFSGNVNSLNGDLSGAMDHAPTGEMGRLGNLLDSAATSVGVTNTTDPRGMLQVNLGLDLTDPRNRQAFEAFLKNPAAPGDLLSRLGDSGTLDLHTYQGTVDKEGAEIGVQAVFGIGAKSETTTTEMELTDAWTLDANGLRRRTDCLK
ncbi:hypothetical protein [Actinomadura sp. 7K507]|uniref:hypothetical protein n=1 Tax=Actinomadura sp. 7K507 TaxID=2530365 RepID=UPI001047E985|nr:hypothetical protein [Actinomadura sp. 7K507]TDC93351.1 hypothetical protein E1285_10215 [Actinomadura sp. 7K507]